MSDSPRAFREKHPYSPPPPEYKPPSVLAEYKVLAIVFAAACVAFALYCFRTPRAPRPIPTQMQPVYIDAIPQKPPQP